MESALTTPVAPVSTSTPFFILGCPRSGTSLLSRMINAHPRLCVPQETQIFPHFLPLLSAYGDLNKESNRRVLVSDIAGSVRLQEDLEGAIDASAVLNQLDSLESVDFGSVFRAFMEQWQKTQGKPRWGEKTPQNAHTIDALLDYFPEAKYLNIVRDGRDVMMSLLDTEFGPKNPRDAAKYWCNYLDKNQHALERVNPDQQLTVHYEELLAEPVAVLEQICGFLDEDYSDSMLEFSKERLPANIEKKNAQKLKLGLQAGNRNKWKKALGNREIELFEGVAADTLEREGYPVVGTSISRDTLTRRESLSSVYKRTVGMVKNRRSQKEAVYRLRCYLNAQVRCH